jgi:AcrR family transcriptional regulator
MNIVQVEGASAINTIVTSKEEILAACREIVSQEGLPALNMRAVAKKCGVALGSLYNYFPNKEELVLETIGSVWRDIFRMDGGCGAASSFPGYVAWIFESVRQGAEEYPNFFTAHSLSFASEGKGRAKKTMDRYLAHIQAGMAEALRNDPRVRKDAFSDDFPAPDFLEFVLTGAIALLLQQKKDCRVLLEMIKKTIY